MAGKKLLLLAMHSASAYNNTYTDQFLPAARRPVPSWRVLVAGRSRSEPTVRAPLRRRHTRRLDCVAPFPPERRDRAQTTEPVGRPRSGHCGRVCCRGGLEALIPYRCAWDAPAAPSDPSPGGRAGEKADGVTTEGSPRVVPPR